MRIKRAHVHVLKDIPITPPPFRAEPSRANALIFEIETDDGLSGWSMANHGHELMAEIVNVHMQEALVGEDVSRIGKIWHKLSDPRPDAKFGQRRFGRLFALTMSNLDIALWDVRAKSLGQTVHQLLGGAQDRIPVYITHGAAYHGAPPYSSEELAAEAKHLVGLGIHHLKETVGRTMSGVQFAPDPFADADRVSAVRDAVGPDVAISMDGNSRMRLKDARRLCSLVESLGVRFFEEPIVDNDPTQMRILRESTGIEIAAAENSWHRISDYLAADAIDVVQPNVVHDGGFTGALKLAAMAEAARLKVGHGNGAGPLNIPFQAALSHGTIVEYHYHQWMAYNEVFLEVPQPIDGYLHPAQVPGHGLQPNPEALAKYSVSRQ